MAGFFFRKEFLILGYHLNKVEVRVEMGIIVVPPPRASWTLITTT